MVRWIRYAAVGLAATALWVAPAGAAKKPSLSKLQRNLQRALAAGDTGAAGDILVEVAGVDDKKATRLLVGMALKTDDEAVFDACRRAMRELSGPKAIAEAHKMLGAQRGSMEPRVLVAEAFGHVDAEVALEGLLAAATGDPDPVVRREALGALGRKRDRRALQVLCESYAAQEADRGRTFMTVRRALVDLTGLAYATGQEWLDFWKTRGESFDFEGDYGAGEEGESVVRRPTFFGSEIASSRVVIVVDTSGSMEMWDPDGETTEDSWTNAKPPAHLVRMTRTKQELERLIDALGPEVHFNILAFSGSVKRWQKQVVEASPDNVADAKAFVGRLRADGGTYTGRALEEAFADTEADMIILLSDGAPMKFGEERLDAKYRDGILSDITRNNRFRRVRIDCIGFDGPGVWPKVLGPRPTSLDKQKTGDFIRFMQQLAASNGGSYRSIE
jgi:hypothetical protein